MIKKRFLIFFLVFIMLIGISNVAFWKKDINQKIILLNTSDISGDVNGNGKIDSLDYVLIRKHILKLSLLSGDSLARADANNDGKINPLDYVAIKKTIINSNNSSSSVNSKTFKATFTVQDPVGAKSSATELSCTTSGSSCEINVPTLTANKNTTTVLGWNTDKMATTASVNSGGKVTISKDTNYYSITQTLVNVTFSVGEDISGVNVKAQQLSFYNNEHTRCISYNGAGCTIKHIPTIISPGQIVHGFAKTPDGQVINVAKTKYTEDTTLYARIYDDYDGDKHLQAIPVAKYQVIGTIAVQTQAGVDEYAANRFMTFIRALYDDFPNLLLWNGTLTLLSYPTYASLYGSNSAGITFHGSSFSKDFSYVVLNYEYDTYTNKDYYLGTAVHEITHAYNYGIYWNGGLNSAISKTDEITSLYNKYKNESNRPLRNYSYNNSSEFFSDLMSEYYRQYRAFRYNDYPYATVSEGWTAELSAAAEKYNSIGLSYYRSTGRLP